MMTPRNFLKKVRRLIEKGWCQQNFQKKTDNGIQYCIYGAILTTCLENRMGSECIVLKQAKEALNKCINIKKYPGYITYNDAKGRTKNQVLKTLDKAIESLRRK